jgi:Na+/melibiose symporter-like transporter
LMRFATPRDGMVVHNEVKSPVMKRYWRKCLASIAGIISLFILLCSLEVVSSSMLGWSMLAAMVLTLPFFIWCLCCIERERLRLELPLAQAAAARWQSMTATERGRPTSAACSQ